MTSNGRCDVLIRAISRLLVDPDQQDFESRLDHALERIDALQDPACIEALMEMVDDGLDDLIVFQLVHTIERFADETYVQHLISGLPAIWSRSPRWAQLLLLRILNSPSALAQLRARIYGLPDPQRSAVRDTLKALKSSEPQFADRANALLSELS